MVMKKQVLLLLFSLITTLSVNAQEWLTSYTLAKKLALVKNKMMLVVWEDAANYSYPVILENKEGTQVVVELFGNESIKTLVWDYFVPVIIAESNYSQLFNEISDKRSNTYISSFNNDRIKIMDPNGTIFNELTTKDFGIQNLTSLIKKYALDTAFLQAELSGYFDNKNYASTFRLANKYLDFAIYADKNIKGEVINLSNIYMSEADALLLSSDFSNKEALQQKQNLLEIKALLIEKKFRKARRFLKKYPLAEVDEINLALFAFLNYTTQTGLNNINEALKWKSQVLQADLNKVKFIIN